MTQPITITITADAATVERLFDRLIPRAAPVPSWMTETPWFERHGKLTPKEAVDLEASTYGKGLHLEEWQMNVIKRFYGDEAMVTPVKFIAGKFHR